MATAFDSANQYIHTGIGVGTSTVTDSFTNTAGNFIAFLIQNNSTSTLDTINSVTYGGMAATQVGTRQSAASGQATYGFILMNPPTGANNIITAYTEIGVGNTISVEAVSWSGTSLTGQPDAQNGSASGSGTSVTPSITTIADNCWAIVMFSKFNGTSTPTVTNGLTARTSIPGGAQGQIFDSNASVSPAGVYSSAFSSFGAGYEYIIFSIAPGASAATNHNLSLMGVGT